MLYILQLALEGFALTSNSVMTKTFELDDTVGQNTTLSFSYQHRDGSSNPRFSVMVECPSGMILNSSDTTITTIDSTAYTMKMYLPGKAEVGNIKIGL